MVIKERQINAWRFRNHLKYISKKRTACFILLGMGVALVLKKVQIKALEDQE